MKRIGIRLLVLSLCTLLAALAAAPARADGNDPNSVLKGPSQSGQSSGRRGGGNAQPNQADAPPVPDVTTVETEVALEDGATDREQFDSYEARLSRLVAQDPHDFENLAKLGIAYELDGRYDQARSTLEQAVALEPSADAVYDFLAQSLSVTAPGIAVYLNGHFLPTDVSPVLVQGRVLVPVRVVAEKLGAVLTWDADRASATIQLGPDEIVITDGSSTAQVNAAPVSLDLPATIVQGRLLVPLRFLAESLNEVVSYHPGATGTAVISLLDK